MCFQAISKKNSEGKALLVISEAFYNENNYNKVSNIFVIIL